MGVGMDMGTMPILDMLTYMQPCYTKQLAQKQAYMQSCYTGQPWTQEALGSSLKTSAIRGVLSHSR